MKPGILRMSRVSAVGVGLALAMGSVAAPAVAQSSQLTVAAQASVAPAPAPTGLAYSYDEASQTVTVTWAPKDPEDTITRNYRPGLCSSPAGSSCFVSSQIIMNNSFSFKKAPNSTTYFKVYAEDATHQLTGSEVLTITT